MTETAADPTPTNEHLVMLAEMGREDQVVAALRALPTDERTVMFLVDVHGFDYHSAAEIVGVPVGTVASRLSRARLSVRRSLRPPGQGIEERLEKPKAAA